MVAAEGRLEARGGEQGVRYRRTVQQADGGRENEEMQRYYAS